MTTATRAEGYAVTAGALPELDHADRAAMDRLQRPSQHGLLQCDDGPRDRRAVAAARHRPDLYEGTPRLDFHCRMPCALLARNPSRRSRAGHGLSARRRREAASTPSRNCVTPAEGWVSATSENITMHIDMTSAQDRAVSARYPRPHCRDCRQSTPACRGPRASAARWRCPRSKCFSQPLDARSSADQADHRRDQEQHDGDEEDRSWRFRWKRRRCRQSPECRRSTR